MQSHSLNLGTKNHKHLVFLTPLDLNSRNTQTNKEKTCGISYVTAWQELIINYLEKKIHQTYIV